MTTPLKLSHPVRLDDLIEAITTAEPDALAQLRSAVLAADSLGGVADSLVGHFVDQARRSGATWSEIGSSMGVTKQAAQKRFVPKPAGSGAPVPDPNQGFAAFTPQARNALVAAHDAARSARNDEIVAAHLLLGLLAEPESLAPAALAAQGHGPDAVRAAVAAHLPGVVASVPDLVPYGAQARSAIERTFVHARRLGHGAVDTEHLLLAVLEAEGGTGPLSDLGVDAAAVEAFVVRTEAQE